MRRHWTWLRVGRPRGGDPDYGTPRVGGRTTQTVVKIGEQALLVFVAFLAIAPLYVMIVTAFKTNEEFKGNLASVALPRHPTFANFVHAWTDLGFAALIRNSIILSASSAFITTVVAVLGGFALARLEFHGRRLALIGMISLMAVPAIVVIIPLFQLMTTTHVINTYPAAIVAEVGLAVPFGTYLIYVFMRDLPEELFQAAQVEGASNWRQLVWIALPLSLPVIMTVCLVTAIFAWNDLLIPLILWQSEDLRVLMVGLANLAPGRQGGVDIPLVMAGVTIATVPVILLFLVTRRFFVRGLVEGAVK